MSKITLVLCTFFLSGCGGELGIGIPLYRSWMFDGPPSEQGGHPPIYVQGWQDGCHTGAAATTNHFYRYQYEWRQDPDLVMNHTYYRGWKDAYRYCTQYILSHTTDSIIKRII